MGCIVMPKSKFGGIYRDLKARIERGEYPEQTSLPSENVLIGVYQCSRNTVRRALAELAAEGYVQTVQGKGAQVLCRSGRKNEFSLGGIETFREAAADNHFRYETEVVRFEEIHADETLFHRTGFAPGTALLWVERVRRMRDRPLILDRSFFLKSTVGQLSAEIAAASIYDYLENVLNMRIVTSRRVITVERAGPEERNRLDLEGYDCLAVVTSNTYNADGMMFEYTRSAHHPEYFSFSDTAVRRRLRE